MADFSIKLLEVAGLGPALRALRLPFGKESRSDVTWSIDKIGDSLKTHSEIAVNKKDMTLLSTLVKRGDEHAKVLRGVVCWVEIDAPLFWWNEATTYRIGTEQMASTSSMHIECKGLSGDELEKAKAEMQMGHNQKRVWMFSYQALRRIYIQRREHRLPQWREFCEFIKSLPFADELILAGLGGKE